MVTLSDYSSPELFRPTIGLNNSTFCDKWCEITNKCSFDLMILVIQELSDQLTLVGNQIQETRDKVNTDFLNKDKHKELCTECLRKADIKKNMAEMQRIVTGEGHIPGEIHPIAESVPSGIYEEI